MVAVASPWQRAVRRCGRDPYYGDARAAPAAEVIRRENCGESRGGCGGQESRIQGLRQGCIQELYLRWSQCGATRTLTVPPPLTPDYNFSVMYLLLKMNILFSIKCPQKTTFPRCDLGFVENSVVCATTSAHARLTFLRFWPRVT